MARPPLDASLGIFRLSSGHVVELADYRRLQLPVWAIDYTTGAFRALRPTASGFAAGPSVLRQSPAAARLRVDGDRLTWTPTGGTPLTGTRLPVKQYEVRFPSSGLMLAGTLTVPDSPGRHPAVAVVHGSGPSLRDEGQFTAGLFLQHGIAVLNYDKRGNGESGGEYPGELATPQAIGTYARDAEAAIGFLSRQPDLDPSLLGLFGGSQGGWIVPLAASRSPLVRFAVLESGPVVSVGQSDDFAGYTTQGASPLTQPLAKIDALVAKEGPSGFDPQPSIRRLRIPVLWLYGGLDMNQPTDLDVRALEHLSKVPGRDFAWHVYPSGNHGLFQVKTGLNSELAASAGLPRAFFADLASWLHAHRIH
ncbi:MAG TPA: alpha/beta hydrolase [Gaiellaceae bacterium]|nr:alpha/beta hydrolase [Gaiellaceae bacterium]